MTNRKTEVVVIGGGPGGYVAAIRLGQLGKKVLLVEKENLGGVCLNVGCIPSKALITAAKRVAKIKEASKMGITIQGLHIDFGKMLQWKGDIVKKLTSGVAQLCQGNCAEILYGVAKFRTANQIDVQTKDGSEVVEADHCIIATGSLPIQIPGFAFDGERVISSTEALSLPRIPEKLVVIGGGYIGLELGIMYAHLGAQVTIVEMMAQLLPGFDPEIVKVINQSLKKKGIPFFVNARATRYEKTDTGVRVYVENAGKEQVLEGDHVLVTVGRRPNSEGLNLAAAGVAVDSHGFIAVDKQLRTGTPNIFAIGDVAGNPMLAHKASKEGEVAAEVIAGRNATRDYKAMPAVIFTDPEVATVGLSAAEATASGREIRTGKFWFAASGRALTTGDTDGFIKVIVDAKSHEVLGLAIVGPEASDLISEATLALEMGAYAEDIGLTVHAHPTLGESVMEAARLAIGEAIHAVNR
ncbi:MAG: dihydrolipoyl dehydrogenase [Acidobacteria bacterium]|nr:dihydrolipoyl dehydrogenase [Acidobacteriota bacterium]